MRTLLVCAAAAVAMLAATTSSRAETVVEPDWRVKPAASALSKAFPPLAQALAISGAATISCTVTLTGEATDCAVVSEFPRGLGFGPAALSMAPALRFTPKQVDGQPVAGGTVRFPIRFAQPEPALLPAKLAPSSPGALVLARRLVAADPAAALTESFATATGKLETEPMAGVDPATQRRGAEAIRTTARAVIPAWADAVATAYANLTPEDQIAAGLAFAESPAGRAYKAHTAEIQGAYGAAGDRVKRTLGVQILKLWCARQASCPNLPASPGAAAAPAVSPAAGALVLARRIVAADGVPAGFARVAAMISPEALTLPGADGPARAAIATAARTSFDAESAKALEDLAGLHARLFTEGELAEILAFKLSPAAARMREQEPALRAAYAAINAGYASQISTRARALFCKPASCEPPMVPAPRKKP